MAAVKNAPRKADNGELIVTLKVTRVTGVKEDDTEFDFLSFKVVNAKGKLLDCILTDEDITKSETSPFTNYANRKVKARFNCEYVENNNYEYPRVYLCNFVENSIIQTF